jgi:hypothetical protein
MRLSTWGSWTVSGIALCCSVACGSSPPPDPPPDETAGHEEPPPPPPPAPASVIVVHASPDPGLSTLSLRIDDAEPIVSNLAAGSSSAPIEIASGSHAVHLLGVASVETGEAPEVLVTNVELSPGSRPLILVYGEPGAEPTLTVTVLDEDATGTSTRGRIVHGLVGVDAVDVCVGTTPIVAALAPGVVSPITPIGDGVVAIALHAANETPCHGRALGIAHATLAAGTGYLVTLSGHAPRARGRMTGSVVVCSEGASVSCENAAIGAR